MKIKHLFYAGATALAIAVAAPSVQASSNETTISEETREGIANFRQYSAEQSEEAIEAGENLLDQIDNRLTELDLRIEEAGDEAATEWREQKAVLEARRADVAAKLEELREDSGDTWDDIRDAFADAYSDLSDAISEAWNDLTS